MRDMPKRLPGMLLGLLLCAAPIASAEDPAPAAQEESWDARLADVKGDVQIFEGGGEQGLPAEKDMPVNEGDRLLLGADGSADLTLDGGSLIHLSANTDFTVGQLDRKSTAFKLAFGTFLAKIEKLLSAQSLIVQTPTAVAAVRGTEFGVEVDKESPDEAHVGVFDEGKVEVKGESGGSEILIGGQETKVVKGQAPARAYQLSRLARHRSYMRGVLKKRLSGWRKRWKALPQARRRELRAKALSRMREHGEKLKERRQRLKEEGEQRLRGKQRGDAEVERKKKKMDEFRESIRRRRGGQ
ncbi:MAG: FecR domain-containing protein [Elusimicrobia bacterium]|nr:FecR domain-containing protein [Elusimicrobiota bacterium]